MGLSIKNVEAYQLASELSQITGMSLTSVVIDALQRRLATLKQYQEKEHRVQEIMAIGKRCAAHLHSSPKSTTHGGDLYGEQGLPIE